MSELMTRGFNTVEEAFDSNGQLLTSDVPPEVLSFLRTLVQSNSDIEYLGDANSPFPIPDFLKPLEVRGDVLRYSDNVYIRLPAEDVDVGDIPEIEYSDDPLLDTGPLSTRRKQRLDSEMDVLFGTDRTRGFDINYEMNIPEEVVNDPYGSDFTGQMVISDE